MPKEVKMGQTLIFSLTGRPYVLMHIDRLRVNLETHCLQLCDDRDVPFPAIDDRTGEPGENRWFIDMKNPRQYKSVAETLAESHYWIVRSYGGNAREQRFDFAKDGDREVSGVPASLRHEPHRRLIIMTDTFGSEWSIPFPRELLPFVHDTADLIASSHGLSRSEYLHGEKTTIWRRPNRPEAK